MSAAETLFRLAALILLGVAVAANLVIWGSIPARTRRVPLVQPHAGRHVNGRNLGDQPRHDQRPGRQPWLTAGQPVLAPEPAPETDRYPAEEFLDLPVVPGFMRMPVYGQAPQSEVERLAKGLII